MDAKKDQRNLLQKLNAAWREAPRDVLRKGYRETPQRKSESWFLIYYFLPALFFPFSLLFFLQAITPIPSLADAPVLEGAAKIYRHPSRGIGTVILTRPGHENTIFYCRYGTVTEPGCLPQQVLREHQHYQDKPLKVWVLPRIVELDAFQNVALQIELDGKVVYSYKDALSDINSGGFLLTTHTGSIGTFVGYIAYWLWVIIGFPFMNYKHWKKEQ